MRISFILLILVIILAFYAGSSMGQPSQDGVPPFPEVTFEKLIRDSWAIPLILFGLLAAGLFTIGETLFPAIAPPNTAYVVRTSNPWKGFKGINQGRNSIHNRFV